MPLKTYRGPSAAALLAQVQAELGEDAVIVRTAPAAGGIEIVAADPETAETVSRLMGAVAKPASTGATAARSVSAPATPAPVKLERTVIGLVGPTGAGKTTTIAKLAAHPRVFQGRKVGLLSLDTYRVGAMEQLQIHAELASIPLAVVHESSDLSRALRELRQCDVILADCPGRGPRFQRDADAVRDILRELGTSELHLVLPAGIQAELARRLAAHHMERGVTHLLVSKVDEIPDDWTLFELAIELGLPMRWLADGQRVPQDIRSAAPRYEAARAALRSRQARRQAGVA